MYCHSIDVVAAVPVGARSRTVQSVSWSPSPINLETAMVYSFYQQTLFCTRSTSNKDVEWRWFSVPETRLS
ncbi:hypothetical protein DPMN_173848 [Dreissena polymorpha]|uniref:Uncharacterized protein n=1 Tax=Dreissena polymorpha TaxID=45954 RepID=A0A9D4E3M7_DREPO|nr:hypothetical protein DPMN_173848 [Dreissena polymorpha]